MNKQNEWKSVYYTISKAFAAVVWESLQKGGYECVVERNKNNEIHIIVKSADFANALKLLRSDQKH